MNTNSCLAVAVIDLGDFSRPEMQGAAARFAQRKLGGSPLIVRMARRLSDCAQVDQVYVVGSNIPCSLLTSGIAGVRSINLPSAHVCERLCAAADDSGAQWIVHVPANRPFVDATLIDQLLANAKRSNDCDYVGYASGGGDRRRMDHLGLAGEACHEDTLRRLRRNADRLPAEEAGSIASWLESAPGVFHLRFIPVPTPLDRDDLRFAVEDETDWDDAQLLCESVVDADSQWHELTQLVMCNEGLRESMATRNV
ncbi:MAG: NTP transferase domain-containing protein [Pirellulales bacterium]|nr:NTP transferase domain-containing protein [Pirellulales bacterium]